MKPTQIIRFGGASGERLLPSLRQAPVSAPADYGIGV